MSPTLLDIKKELRAAMNGVAAKTLRESGLGYRLTFGVDLPRLQEIAAQFTPGHSLAQELWHEDIRECKMLAVLLQPREQFFAEVAEIWIESLLPAQAELAQLMCMHLVFREPYAAEMAFRWMADERQMFQLCGFLTLARLLMQGAQLSPTSEDEFRDQAQTALSSDYLPLRKAAANALLHLDANRTH